MRIFRSILGYAFAALACLGFSSLSFASDAPAYAYSSLKRAVCEVGAYGADFAKAKIELAYMVSVDSVSTGVGEGLVKMSNGFVQKSLTIDEVALGMIGSTASTQLS